MSYSMPLQQLLSVLQLESSDSTPITSLCIDSRKVTAGSLFCAYPGGTVDGRDFIAAAQQAGATAVVYEAGEFELSESIEMPSFAVTDLQSKVGLLADLFYAHPSQDLQVFGVTGTNGKTTCCYLLTQALELLGVRAAMIGTIGSGELAELESASHTTPDPIAVHATLAKFRDQGITQVCMEVSSHALDQGRLNGVHLFCALFTNLSHDHLDYHGDMASYGASKTRLFSDFSSELAVINIDDELGKTLPEMAHAEFVVSYGDGGDVYAEDVSLSADGIGLVIEANGVDFELTTPLVGKVNVPNIELLAACLLGLSTPVDEIQTIFRQLKPAPGRMELFSQSGRPNIVVDYAHTPDALEKALLSIRQHCVGQLWCVFGCGGDRDQAKRPLMGAAAAKYADCLVITNDNPRSEPAEQIAEQIARGIQGDVEVILDRQKAIQHCVARASQNDWVLIAGKGHETTQQIGDQTLPFSDREQVLAALELAA